MYVMQNVSSGKGEKHNATIVVYAEHLAGQPVRCYSDLFDETILFNEFGEAYLCPVCNRNNFCYKS